MRSGNFDYGHAGIIGIATPQANPTVETEMRLLFPLSAILVIARLTCRSSDSATRLRSYIEELPQTLDQFDTLPISALGFACTASTYLVGSERQKALIGEIERRSGHTVVTATDAIAWRLDLAGARRIALVSPYTPELTEAATTHWRDAGYDVRAVRRIETGTVDTRSIYALGSEDARGAVTALSELDVDAVLVSGTGMPSLPLIAAAASDRPLLLSSNFCLAQRLCHLLGLPTETEGWRARVIDATSRLEPIA